MVTKNIIAVFNWGNDAISVVHSKNIGSTKKMYRIHTLGIIINFIKMHFLFKVELSAITICMHFEEHPIYP